MKRIIHIIVILFWAQSVKCQIDSINMLFVSISTGIEAHDKRLFGYSEKEILLDKQPEFWGTHHIGFEIKRKLLSKDNFVGFIGSGLNFEKATFQRPFDHLYFKKDSFYILRTLDSYKKVLLPISISTFFKLKPNLFLQGTINSNFIISRSIHNPKGDSSVFPYKETTLNFEGFHITTGIIYRLKHNWLGLNSRMLNFQKIDTIIFNYLIKDPRTDIIRVDSENIKKWELTNPLRINFTIGYNW